VIVIPGGSAGGAPVRYGIDKAEAQRIRLAAIEPARKGKAAA